MCGICGIFRADGGAVDASRAVAMRDLMTYRGPDASGLVSGPGYALGHRRLSIIDLSANGSQPLGNEDDSVQVVFNGAIYNFPELRQQLVSKGHCFRSKTDTEVLVHGYEEWGIEALLRRIRGMYAFALLDIPRRQIHLARDPLGKKPLFFRFGNGELLFASSSRALLRGMDSVPAIDPVAIDQLLCNNYIWGSRSLCQGIEKLLPGHALTIGAQGERRDFIHWQPDFLHHKQKLAAEEWEERIAEALQTAVRRRLIADVPIGVLLSGGVDSSLVTALAARLQGKVRTFSVANEDPRLDERHFAQAVADACGTQHQELEVRSDIRQRLTALVAAMGEPLADASAANVFAIAEKAREFVTVVLTGDGGDEAFGGYTQFLGYYLAERLRRACVPAMLPALGRLGVMLWKGDGLAHRAGTLLRLVAVPLQETLFAINSNVPPDVRSALYTPAFQAELGGRLHNQHYLDALPANGTKGSWDVDRVMEVHVRTTLADDYLAKVDGGTMAVSLEARSPFLDVEVMELAMSMPPAVKFRGNKAKSALRSLASRYVPRHCVERRKQGFAAPIHLWLRGDWDELVQELVLGPQVENRGWFRRDTLRSVVQAHRQGAAYSDMIWALMILEIWMRLSVDNSLLPTDSL